jgi:hypothetical protein
MEELLLFLKDSIYTYGVWIIIIIGIMHPYIAFPAHIFVLTISISILGIVNGYVLLAFSNIIGILLFYPSIRVFSKRKNDINNQTTFFSKISRFVKNEPAWKHAIVLGAPLIPTHPLKYMIPFSGMSYRRYLMIFLSAYLILFLSNTLLYFGTLSFFNEYIPTYIGVILMTVFVLIIYFGKKLFQSIGF